MPTIANDRSRLSRLVLDRPDRRAPVRCYSQEKLDRGIIDAARSTSILGVHGSACAALVEYSEAVYADRPGGGTSADQ